MDIQTPETEFFESSEKLLEIFIPESNFDLRTIPKYKIEAMLNLAKCKILIQHENDSINSFVLSESSLFITQRRIILKTCGTTDLMNAFMFLLNMLEELGVLSIGKRADTQQQQQQQQQHTKFLAFYSHRQFLRPKYQPCTHRNYRAEITRLNDILKQQGVAAIFGSICDESWHLYVNGEIPRNICEPDHTLEVIMTGLDEQKMRPFWRKNASNVEASKISGIDSLFPEADLAEFLFEPCGYSVNGILPNEGYFNIHVTPQAECSYVSFETNVPAHQTHHSSEVNLTRKIISLFSPTSFFVTLITNQYSQSAREHESFFACTDLFEKFERNQCDRKIIMGYDVTFVRYMLVADSVVPFF